VRAGWSIDQIPVTLASLTLGNSGQEVVSSSDLAWCRSVEEQLDSAASVCVVEISKLEAGGADDLAWVQSPRVRLREFMSSTPRLPALVAGAAPSLRLEDILVWLSNAPSLSVLQGCDLASVTTLSVITCTNLTSLEGLVDAQLQQLQGLRILTAMRWPACRGLRGRVWAV